MGQNYTKHAKNDVNFLVVSKTFFRSEFFEITENNFKIG